MNLRKSLNKSKMAAQLADLSEYLAELETLRQIDKEEFRTVSEHRRATERLLQIAIETLINIGNRIISSMGFRSAEDYADVFRVLAENGVIDEDFSAILVNMARFRNRLVHIYWRVNLEELYDVLQNRLDDFARFEKCILDFIERSL